MINKKSIFSLLILIFIMFVFSCALLSEETRIRVIKEGALLKLKPDFNSLTITNIPPGAILDVVKIVDGWMEVKLPPDENKVEIIGYIHSSYVESELPAKSADYTKLKVDSAKQQPLPSVESNSNIEKTPINKREWPLEIGVGLSGGYANPSNQLYSGGMAFGFCVSIGFMKYLAIEITGQYFSPKVESSEEGLSKGTLSVMPIQLSIQGRYPLSGGRLMPYLELGGGYYLNKFTVDGDLAGGWEQVGFTLEEKVESAMGFHFGAGLDFYVIQNLSLGLGFKYCLTKMKGSWSLTDIASSTAVSGELTDLELNPIMFGLRVRYNFK